jgi:DNA-binding XRE family transcriptional regulator
MSWQKQLCVYTHAVNGEVFYVGQGTRSRALSRSGKSRAWNARVGAAGGYEIDIVHWAGDRHEAIRVESELIAANPSACNVIEHDPKPYLPPCPAIPQYIRRARVVLGLTLSELAKRAGLSRLGIDNIERGTSDPKRTTLLAIQRALEAAGVEFIGDRGVMLK